MKRLLACCAALCVLWTATSAPAGAATEPLGLVTGPKTGTYYAFGKDMAESAERAGVELAVKTSEGSIDNIKRLGSSENAALGIIQSDVLGFLARSKSADSAKIAKNLRLVFPFYNEEVHVLARRDIRGFTGLKGKKVAIGEEGSGNMLTAINLFSLLEVVPGEMRKIPPAQGVAAVLKGELDAVIFVGGKPVRLFKNLEELSLPENQKFASMLAAVHFLPLDSARLLEEYRPATLSPADYDFITAPVPTIAVQAALVAHDFSGNKKRCKQMYQFANAIRADMDRLRSSGHPKWKEVRLDGPLGQWKQDGCTWGHTLAAASPSAKEKPAGKKTTHKQPQKKKQKPQ